MSDSTQGASPKARRFFYPQDRIHHAYCMAIDFGMRLQVEYPGGALRDVTKRELLSVKLTGWTADKFFIHPDSLTLMEPLPGDVVQVFGQVGFVPEGDGFVERYAQKLAKSNCQPHATGRIIQRNGKAFHWPEQEAA
jgi:hypothetical protein